MLELNKKTIIKGTVEQIYKFSVLSNVCLRDQNGVECYFCIKTNKNTYNIGDNINIKGSIVEVFQPTKVRELQYRFKVVK